MFASQAALVIANARRYREEQRARADLETLINTAPVGVAVFDGRTGAPVSFNREAVRILDGLRPPQLPPERLLEVLTVRRAGGRESSLEELSTAQALSAGKTVRAGFLGMVSHELQAPLASIRGSAATLLQDEADLDPAGMRQFFRIDEQGQGMGGLGRWNGRTPGARGPVAAQQALPRNGAGTDRPSGRSVHAVEAKRVGDRQGDASGVLCRVEVAGKRGVGSQGVGNKRRRLPGGSGRLAVRGGAEGAAGCFGTATG